MLRCGRDRGVPEGRINILSSVGGREGTMLAQTRSSTLLRRHPQSITCASRSAARVDPHCFHGAQRRQCRDITNDNHARYDTRSIFNLLRRFGIGIFIAVELRLDLASLRTLPALSVSHPLCWQSRWCPSRMRSAMLGSADPLPVAQLRRCSELEYLLLGDLREMLEEPFTPQGRNWTVAVIDTLLDMLPREISQRPSPRSSRGVPELVRSGRPARDAALRPL